MFKPRLPKDKQMRQGVSNIDRATTKSRRAPGIHQHLDQMATDILCLCEAYSEFREGRGHRIECDEDYGYTTQLGRRKAMLWSRQPWHDVDVTGDEALPPGRFVSGTTQITLGPVRVIGVCIPWSHAHLFDPVYQSALTCIASEVPASVNRH